MTRSDVTLCSWKSPAPSAGNTGFYLSSSVSTNGWLQNLWTCAGTCVHCTNTCPRHQPLWPATWSSASLTHGQACRKNAIDKAVGQWRKRLRANIKAKGHHFEHLLNWNRLFLDPTILQNRLFLQPLTVYRGKCVVSRHFHHSYLKANKVSKVVKG